MALNTKSIAIAGGNVGNVGIGDTVYVDQNFGEPEVKTWSGTIVAIDDGQAPGTSVQGQLPIAIVFMVLLEDGFHVRVLADKCRTSLEPVPHNKLAENEIVNIYTHIADGRVCIGDMVYFDQQFGFSKARTTFGKIVAIDSEIVYDTPRYSNEIPKSLHRTPLLVIEIEDGFRVYEYAYKCRTTYDIKPDKHYMLPRMFPVVSSVNDQNMSSEMKEGYDAYWSGQSSASNPYVWSNKTWWMYEAWEDGWKQADDDD